MDIVLKRRNLTADQLIEKKVKKLKWKELDNAVRKVAFNVILKEDVQDIGILYDCDVDGLFSGYILEDFFGRLGKKVKRYMNPNKEHGIKRGAMKWVRDNNISWLFVVDAGSGDTKEINYLVKKWGVNVVVLDHHPYKRTTPLVKDKAWVVNPLDHEHLPKLSGCGVVFRFIEQLGVQFKVMTEMYEKYVGITVISDICSMRDAENRYYVRRAYAEYRGNHFLNQFKFYGSYRSFYGFGVIPYLNALIRIGEGDRAMRVVNSMDIRSKMNSTERDRLRVRTRQEKMIAELRAAGKFIEMEDVVMHVRTDRKDLRSVGGLLANNFLGEYKRSALILCWSPEIRKWVGSFRGINFENKELQKWNIICRGHDLACGVEVDNETLKKFRKEFKLQEGIPDMGYDFIASLKGLKPQTWLQLADFNEMSGAGVPEVVIKLKETLRDAVRVDPVGQNKVDITFEDGTVVTDFTGKEDDDEILVTPILAKNGYQLLRA